MVRDHTTLRHAHSTVVLPWGHSPLAVNSCTFFGYGAQWGGIIVVPTHANRFLIDTATDDNLWEISKE